MTPATEKAEPIPADVLALTERLRSMGQDIRSWGPAYRDRARADMLRAAALLADRASQEERIREDERARERARVTAREKRRVITWLHQRANAMNDPHARQILNSAATNLGWDNADARLRGDAS